MVGGGWWNGRPELFKQRLCLGRRRLATSDQRNDFRNAVFIGRHGRGLHDGRWRFHERWRWWWRRIILHDERWWLNERWWRWWLHERRWWRIILVFFILLLLPENCYIVPSYPINRNIFSLFHSQKKGNFVKNLIRSDAFYRHVSRCS